MAGSVSGTVVELEQRRMERSFVAGSVSGTDVELEQGIVTPGVSPPDGSS